MRFTSGMSARDKAAARKRVERIKEKKTFSEHIKDKTLVERIGHLVTFHAGILEERRYHRSVKEAKKMRCLLRAVRQEKKSNGENIYMAKPSSEERKAPFSRGLCVMHGPSMRFRMTPAVLRYHGGVHKLHTRRMEPSAVVEVESNLNPEYWKDVTNNFPM